MPAIKHLYPLRIDAWDTTVALPQATLTVALQVGVLISTASEGLRRSKLRQAQFYRSTVSAGFNMVHFC